MKKSAEQIESIMYMVINNGEVKDHTEQINKEFINLTLTTGEERCNLIELLKAHISLEVFSHTNEYLQYTDLSLEKQTSTEILTELVAEFHAILIDILTK